VCEPAGHDVTSRFLSGEYSTAIKLWQTKLIETRRRRCHKNDKARQGFRGRSGVYDALHDADPPRRSRARRGAVPVAVALRHSLIEIASTRNAQQSQQTKMELVYQYLTGPRFKQRLEGIIEKFDELRDDLDKERKFMNRVWAKREGQVQGVIDSIPTGHCGQGFARNRKPRAPPCSRGRGPDGFMSFEPLG
jgi:hypothetical protein